MKTKSNYVVQILTLLFGVFTLAVVSSCGEKQENGHGYVDLGLPSGTMWATCNFGASNPKEYGERLSWLDIKKVKKPWGGKWRIPTGSEVEELFNFCEAKKETKGNVIGISLKGPNGNSIFIPCAGYQLTKYEEYKMPEKEDVSGIGKSARIWTGKEETLSYTSTGWCGKLYIRDDGTISKNLGESDFLIRYGIYRCLNSLRLVFTQETK